MVIKAIKTPLVAFPRDTCSAIQRSIQSRNIIFFILLRFIFIEEYFLKASSLKPFILQFVTPPDTPNPFNNQSWRELKYGNITKYCLKFNRELENSNLSFFDYNTMNRPEAQIPILIVGLGNIGYASGGSSISRHNIGFAFVNYVQTKLKLPAFEKCANLIADISESESIVLAKPRTYMNLSGMSVQLLFEKYKNYYSIIVHDELDKKVGEYSLKNGGGSNGHRGLKSIMNSINTNQFKRIRIGIDRPNDRLMVPDYVVDNMSLDDASFLQNNIFEEILELIQNDCKSSSIRYSESTSSTSSAEHIQAIHSSQVDNPTNSSEFINTTFSEGQPLITSSTVNTNSAISKGSISISETSDKPSIKPKRLRRGRFSNYNSTKRH